MKGIYMVDADMGFVQYFENLIFQNTTEYKVLGHSFKANDFLIKIHNKPELLKKIDFLFVNPKLNDMNGLELIKKIQGYRKDINVCIIINENIKNFFMNDISELGIENIMIYPNEDDYFLENLKEICSKTDSYSALSDMRQTILDSDNTTTINSKPKHSEEEDKEVLQYLTSKEFLSQFDFNSLTDEFLANYNKDNKDNKGDIKKDIEQNFTKETKQDTAKETFDFKKFNAKTNLNEIKPEENLSKTNKFDFSKNINKETSVPKDLKEDLFTVKKENPLNEIKNTKETYSNVNDIKSTKETKNNTLEDSPYSGFDFKSFSSKNTDSIQNNKDVVEEKTKENLSPKNNDIFEEDSKDILFPKTKDIFEEDSKADYSQKRNIGSEEQNTKKSSIQNDFVNEYIKAKDKMPFNLDELNLSKSKEEKKPVNNTNTNTNKDIFKEDISTDSLDNILGNKVSKDKTDYVDLFENDKKKSPDAYTRPIFDFSNKNNTPERGFDALENNKFNHHKGFGTPSELSDNKKEDSIINNTNIDNPVKSKDKSSEVNDIFSSFNKNDKVYVNPFGQQEQKKESYVPEMQDEIPVFEIKEDAPKAKDEIPFDFSISNPFAAPVAPEDTQDIPKTNTTDKANDFKFENHFSFGESPNSSNAKNNGFKEPPLEVKNNTFKEPQPKVTDNAFKEPPLDNQTAPVFGFGVPNQNQNQNQTPYQSYPPNTPQGNQEQIRDIYNNSGAQNLSFNPSMGGNQVENYRYEKGGNVNNVPDFAKQIVAFYSVKGGIGKTSLAVNTTIQLAKYSKKKICLIDFDLTNANIHTHLGILDSTYDLSVISNFESEIDSYSLSKIITKYKVKDKNGDTVDFDVIVGFKEMTMLQRFNEKEVHKILTILEDMYDIVVVDTHPVYTDVAISTILKQSTKIIFVTEQEMTALNGAKDFVLASKRYGIPPEKLFLVLNKYKASTPVFTKARLEKSLGKEVMAVIPHDMDSLREAVNTNNPVTLSNPESNLSRAYIDIAKIIDKSVVIPDFSKGGLFGMFKK